MSTEVITEAIAWLEAQPTKMNWFEQGDACRRTELFTFKFDHEGENKETGLCGLCLWNTWETSGLGRQSDDFELIIIEP